MFLGEFKTVKGHRKNILLNAEPRTATAMDKFSANDLVNLLTRVKHFLNNSYDIQRERATEAVTFMLSDTDRMFSTNHINASPFCYFLSGYSLPVSTMRKIVEKATVHAMTKEPTL